MDAIVSTIGFPLVGKQYPPTPPPPPPHTGCQVVAFCNQANFLEVACAFDCGKLGSCDAGGPAGSMEGGRQAEIAKSILGSMNVPYIVAAPLLIQVSPLLPKSATCTSLALPPSA